MTGKKALGALIVDKKKVHRKAWGNSLVLSFDDGTFRATFSDGTSRSTDIGDFDWNANDWEIYETPLECSFVDLFKHLGPGLYATKKGGSPTVRYCLIDGDVPLLSVYDGSVFHDKIYVGKPLVESTFLIHKGDVQ